MTTTNTATAQAEYGPRVRPLDKEDLDRLLTKSELAQKLSLPSVRYVEELVNKRRVPFVRLGYRTVRFDWRKVQAALERLTVKEVGA